MRRRDGSLRAIATIALAAALAPAVVGCGSESRVGRLENEQVCRGLANAGCDWAVRCAGETDRGACVSETMDACCDGESCRWPAEASRSELDACEQAIRNAYCEQDGSSLTECEGLLGGEPGDRTAGGGSAGSGSGSDDEIVLDAGARSGAGAGTRHEQCYYDSDCGADAEGCFVIEGEFYDETADVCTSRCDGPDDTVHCEPDEQCVDADADRPAVCYKRCDGDTDCPRHLLCKELTPYTRVCVP